MIQKGKRLRRAPSPGDSLSGDRSPGLNSVPITSNLDLLKTLSENGSKPSKNDQQMIQNSQKMIKLGT